MVKLLLEFRLEFLSQSIYLNPNIFLSGQYYMVHKLSGLLKARIKLFNVVLWNTILSLRQTLVFTASSNPPKKIIGCHSKIERFFKFTHKSEGYQRDKWDLGD